MIMMRVTFQEVEWEPGLEDPIIRGGWCNPLNLTDFLKIYDDIEHDEDDIPEIEFASVWDAAMFVSRFHGDVWDYRDGGEGDVDARGVHNTYTLHVDGHPFVFALADFIESRSNRPRPADMPRRAGNSTMLLQVQAKDVTVGMYLDLEADYYADPDRLSFFASDYAVVTDVDWENKICVVIGGHGWRVAFPKDHLLARRMTDIEEKKWLNWRP